MKLTIDRTKLVGVIPPLKSCSLAPVLLNASGKLLHVTFYDESSRGVCNSAPVSVVEEGLAAFDPYNLDKLTKWLKKAGRDCSSILIEGIAGGVFVFGMSGDSAKAIRLPSIVPDDFCAPVIIRPTGELAEVPVTLLMDVVSRAKAGSNAPGTFYAENLCISFSQKGTKIIWTDGCIMFYMDYPEGVCLESGRVVVPLSAAISLLKQADPAGDTVVFGKSSIRCGSLSISFSEFNDGKQKYPDFSNIIQPLGDTEISFTAEAFREAMKRVSSCIKNCVVIRSKVGRGINLLAASIEKEHRFEDSPRAQVWFDGEISASEEKYGYASAYCVDRVYLKAVLAGMVGRITIRSTDPASPLYINFENSAIRVVLMPMEADYIYKSV